jgi:hypothetical protein
METALVWRGILLASGDVSLPIVDDSLMLCDKFADLFGLVVLVCFADYPAQHDKEPVLFESDPSRPDNGPLEIDDGPSLPGGLSGIVDGP